MTDRETDLRDWVGRGTPDESAGAVAEVQRIAHAVRLVRRAAGDEAARLFEVVACEPSMRTKCDDDDLHAIVQAAGLQRPDAEYAEILTRVDYGFNTIFSAWLLPSLSAPHGRAEVTKRSQSLFERCFDHGGTEGSSRFKPDPASEKWIAIVRLAAAAGGHHFVYRCASEAPASRSAEMSVVVDMIVAGGTHVTTVDASRPLLFSLLHCEFQAREGGVVAVDVDLIDGSASDSNDEDQFLECADEPVNAVSAAAALMRGARNVYVWRLPPRCDVPPAIVPIVAAAFGPVLVDRAWAEGEIAAMAPGLGRAAVHALLARVRDPRDASAMIALAIEVAARGAASLEEAAMTVARSLTPRWDIAASAPPRPARYDPALVVADHDLHELLARAGALARGGKLMLHGPSGGGKSAFAQALADAMGKPLLERRGSTLWQPKLGESERLVAKAFADAESSGSCLLIEEADSLLAARIEGTSAGNGYLIRLMTNEFLRAFESHPDLPVLATCNDLSAIDPAIARRFDMSISVAAELPEEREATAWRAILAMGPPPGWRPVGRTSVSDYVAAARRCRLLGKTGASSLADAVVKARDARLGAAAKRNAMGFLRAGGRT